MPLHFLPLHGGVGVASSAGLVVAPSASSTDRSRLLYLQSFGSVLLITARKMGDCFRLYSARGAWALQYEWQTQTHTFDVAELTDGRIAWAAHSSASSSSAESEAGGGDSFGVWTLDTSGIRVKVRSETLPGPMFEDKRGSTLSALAVLPALNSVLVSYTLSPSFAPKERHLVCETQTPSGVQTRKLV